MRLFFASFSALVLLSACNTPSPVLESPEEPSLVEVEPNSSRNGTSLQLAFIALEDNGASGPMVGCGDSVVLVNDFVEDPLPTQKDRVSRALTDLFAVKSSSYGESGLYNSLDETSLTVDSVVVSDAVVEVQLSGVWSSAGVCDDPRMVGQIEETIRGNLDLESSVELKVTVNGKTLDQLMDASGK